MTILVNKEQGNGTKSANSSASERGTKLLFARLEK